MLLKFQNNLNTYELIQFDGTSLSLGEDTLFDSGRSKTLFEVHDWGGWCHDSVTSRSFNRYSWNKTYWLYLLFEEEKLLCYLKSLWICWPPFSSKGIYGSWSRLSGYSGSMDTSRWISKFSSRPPSTWRHRSWKIHQRASEPARYATEIVFEMIIAF